MAKLGTDKAALLDPAGDQAEGQQHDRQADPSREEEER